MKRCCFLSLLGILFCVCLGANPVSAMRVEPQSAENAQKKYLVTCDNGKEHTIIANHAEQDFQYFYPNKGYYIKYYDMEFKGLFDFAEWVCRNK